MKEYIVVFVMLSALIFGIGCGIYLSNKNKKETAEILTNATILGYTNGYIGIKKNNKCYLVSGSRRSTIHISREFDCLTGELK